MVLVRFVPSPRRVLKMWFSCPQVPTSFVRCDHMCHCHCCCSEALELGPINLQGSMPKNAPPDSANHPCSCRQPKKFPDPCSSIDPFAVLRLRSALSFFYSSLTCAWRANQRRIFSTSQTLSHILHSVSCCACHLRLVVGPTCASSSIFSSAGR